MLLLGPVTVWIIVGIIAAVMVHGCLRVIGFEYHHAVQWHNLRIEVQSLRAEQKQRLDQMATREGAAAGRPAIAGRVGDAPAHGILDAIELDEPSAAA